MRRIAAAAAILGLGAGTVIYLAASKSVTLVLDGQSTQTSTMNRTVGELLTHQKIDITSYDRVVPTLTTSLKDGMVVSVDFGRPVSLSIDGVRTTRWTTSRTVADVISEAKLPTTVWVSQGREVAVPREGIDLDVRMPKKVSLTVNKKQESVVTTAGNVDQLLTERNVILATLDRAIPALPTPIKAGMKIKVIRVYQKTITKVETIKYPRTKIADKTLLEGKSITKVRGANGSSKITYLYTFANGRVESKKAIKTVVIKPTKPGVIVYGTKKRSVEELNWAALAWCESRNRPTSVSRNKLYYGLFQFSLTTWKSVGGTGKPSEASREEQLMRAKLLYEKRGKQPWPTCGRRLWT